MSRLILLTVVLNFASVVFNLSVGLKLMRPAPKDRAMVQITPEQMFKIAKSASSAEEFFRRLAELSGPWGARP